MSPQVIEQSQRIGQGCALAEDQVPFELVQLELCAIEGHHKQRNAGSEETPRGRDIGEDVVFGLGSADWRVAQIVVAAVDRSSHDDDALELAKSFRISLDQGTDIRKGSNGK